MVSEWVFTLYTDGNNALRRRVVPDRIGPMQIFKVTAPIGPFFGWTVQFLHFINLNQPMLETYLSNVTHIRTSSEFNLSRHFHYILRVL